MHQKYDLFTVLTTRCGVDSALAKSIENTCDKLRITKEGRKRIAQAAISNTINSWDMIGLIDSAPGLILEPRALVGLPMPLSWADLIKHFRYVT